MFLYLGFYTSFLSIGSHICDSSTETRNLSKINDNLGNNPAIYTDPAKIHKDLKNANIHRLIIVHLNIITMLMVYGMQI